MKRFLCLIIVCGLCSCRSDSYETFTGFAQGTTYSIVARNAPKTTAAAIDSLFREMDFTFSMFNPESLVSRVNRNETDVVTNLFSECFALAKQVHSATGGRFDSTIKPLSDAWGFGPGEQQRDPDIDSLMQFVGLDKIRVEPIRTELIRVEPTHTEPIRTDDGTAAGMDPNSNAGANPDPDSNTDTNPNNRIIKDDPRVQLDFSSIAKGLTVDKLAELLETEGVTDYMVEVGGEVRARGVNATGRTWRIQIDKPIEGFAHERQAVVSLDGRAVATSGNYRNWFTDEGGQKRVHIVDPRTGAMTSGEILSASVVASTCALADGWATALVVSGGIETARRLLADAPTGLEYYIIYGTADAMAIEMSGGFPIDE